MTILFLILKIILWIIAILFGFILLIILGLLFLPISYWLEGEKREELIGRIYLNLFGIVQIDYDTERDEQLKLKLFGIYAPKLSKKLVGATEDLEEEAKHLGKVIGKEAVDQTEEIAENTVTNEESRIEGQASKIQPSKIQPDVSTKAQKEKSTNVDSKEQKRQNIDRKPDKESKKKTKKDPALAKPIGAKDIWRELKALWDTDSRRPFFKACKKLLKSWWYALKPKVFYFEILFGLEDPSETGLWIAKLMALYPFYAPYGNVMGNFEEAMFEGCIQMRGRTNLFKFLYPTLVFILNKEVRTMIKMIMNFGKEDEDGLKTQQ